jgi:NADP-dependent 3-hydroxy acid dehydrogenase YdfG
MTQSKKYAIVTGASKGVGYTTAKTLANSGYYVIAVARRLDLLETLISENIEVYQLDVTDFNAIEKFYKKYQDITLDLLVNNAGGAAGHSLLEKEEPEQFNYAYNLNVTGPMYLSKLFLPNLKKSENPTIIFISSMAGKFVYSSGGSYVISKRALGALVELMRLEFSGYGIKITEICPGSIDTVEGENRLEALTAEDLANAILWVASIESQANINHIEMTPIQSRRY